MWGCGGGRFRCDVTFLCNLCTSVSQFHTRCMQIYRVLLIGWFQSGSVVQSCCCWGRTGELPFKMREGAGQKRCGQSWWGWGCVGCGIGAVVQRCNGKCPDSAGGGGGGRVTGVSDITSSPSAFSTPPPPSPVSRRDFANVLQEPSNAHGHVWGILRRHGETSERTQPQTPRLRGALEIWPSDLHFHSEKGLESFPPSLHPLWESQAGYSYWGYQVSSGEKGAKVT